MDYPLHQSQYTDSSNHSRHHQQQQQQQDPPANGTNSTANYRTYSMYNERSDISSIMFDGNSPSNEEDDSRSSMMLLSTRPPHSIHDPWNQPQLHHHQQHHSPLLSHDYRQHQPLQHHQIQQQSSHSERGIAGFVSKLYQCLQSVDSNQKYARWCQHDGKDMFIIDCIPEFTEFVLPRLFKHCKFPSFVRQLNIYGFQRDTDARKSKDTKDKESCRWYHPCFRPGRRDLFHLIRRKATRYSRKRKVKASNEEDPETILNLDSPDESEIDEESQENMILLVNNDEQDGRRSSSVSSVTQSLQHIDYNPTSSQLQLGFSEPVTVATTATTTATSTNSPRVVNHSAMPLVVDTNINMAPSNDYHAMTTPTLAHSSNHHHSAAMLQDDLSSDNADDRIVENGLVVGMQQQHHRRYEQPQQQQLHQPVMRDQELRMQLYHMKQQYEKMQAYFREQLSTAQIQIDEQQIRIQQLEGALGITKHSVKQGTIQQPATGGYMSTVCTTIPNSSASSAFNHANYTLQQQQQQRQLSQNSPIITSRLVNSMYQMPQQSNVKGALTTATPARPNYYYHENASSPSAAAGTTNNNNTENKGSSMMAQIKNEILSSSSPTTPSASSHSWLPYHRDPLSTNGMIDPANHVTAGSSTNPSTTGTGTDAAANNSSKLKPALPSSNANTPLIMHSNVHSTNNSDTNDNHDTSNIHKNKIDLMGHMHFNSFI